MLAKSACRDTARDARTASANFESLLPGGPGGVVELKVHRANWSHAYPENSLAAIGECYDQRVAHAEIDLHVLADEDFLVLHDDLLNATTTGTGRTAALTKRAASQLFVRTPGPGPRHRPPFLSDVAAAIAGKDFPTLLELDLQTVSPIPWDRLEELAGLVAGVSDRVIVGGSDWNMRRLLHVDSSLPVGTGVELYLDWLPAGAPPEDIFPGNAHRGAYGYFDSHPLAESRQQPARDYLFDRLSGICNLTPTSREIHFRAELFEQLLDDDFAEIVTLLHDRGQAVDVWTLNHGDPRCADRLQRLVQAGVDSITTDTARELHAQWSQQP